MVEGVALVVKVEEVVEFFAKGLGILDEFKGGEVWDGFYFVVLFL